MSDISLYKLCIAKTAALLKECYWPVTSYSSNFEVENPFTTFPSDISQELISSVIHLTAYQRPLCAKDLYPILTSGSVKQFKLESVHFVTEEFVNILTILSTYGQYLTTLIIRQIYFQDYHRNEKKKKRKLSSVLEGLLDKSPNLKILKTDIEIDMKTIKKMQSLQQLEIYNVVPQNALYDIIPKKDGIVYIPNDTITHISICETSENIDFYKEIAFLLNYCTNLICIENCVGKALEYLHKEELYCDSLTKVYKLQKCNLGGTNLSRAENCTTVDAIRIATITCPYLTELYIHLHDHQVIARLCDFRHLKSLKIEWKQITCEGDTHGDFHSELMLLLKNTGNQLKNLQILNFTNVDFAAVGIFCPYLESLKVVHDNEIILHDPAKIECFKYLESLYLDCVFGSGLSSKTLMLLLSNCKNLVTMYLENVPHLADSVIFNVMEKKTFSKIKEATIIDCSLTKEGLKCLVKCCPSLDLLNFNSFGISFKAAAKVVRDINPFITMINVIVDMYRGPGVPMEVDNP